MEWIVLGSGAFSPEPGESGSAVRNPAGHAARLGRDVLLFDLGFGNVRQLFRAGLDPAAVTHAFFTHRHPDHVGDLPALLFHYRHAAKPAGGKLHLYGPRGFSSFLRRLSRAHHPWLAPRGFTLKCQDLEEGHEVAGKGWKVRAREVPHSTEAVAYRLNSKTGSVCFTGDTGFDSGLAAFARDVDLFVLECSLTERQRNPNHLTVSQALSLFSASGAKKGLFSHFTRGSFLELSKRLPAKAKAAADLMRISIR